MFYFYVFCVFCSFGKGTHWLSQWSCLLDLFFYSQGLLFPRRGLLVLRIWAWKNLLNPNEDGHGGKKLLTTKHSHIAMNILGDQSDIKWPVHWEESVFLFMQKDVRVRQSTVRSALSGRKRIYVYEWRYFEWQVDWPLYSRSQIESARSFALVCVRR